MTAPINQLPNVGSTGIVQQPGVGGAIAQGLQQLPQILLALQRQKTYEQQVQAQIEALRQAEAARQAQAQQNAATGQFIGDISNPQVGALDIPDLGGMVPTAGRVGVPLPPMSPEQAISRVPVQYRGAALASAGPALKLAEERKKTLSDLKLARSVDQVLGAETITQNRVRAALQSVPPDRRKDFLDQIKSFQGPDGSWVAKDIGPERRIVFFNATTGKTWDTGQLASPPAPGVSLTLPSETERRAGALAGGAVQALNEIFQLRNDPENPYNPLQESLLSKAAGELPLVGRRARYALLSDRGKLYYNAVRRIITNYLYAVSGATANVGEIESQGDQLTVSLFDDAKTLPQKERFLLGKAQELLTLGGRSVRGNASLPTSWDELMKIPLPAENPYR